MGGGKHSEKRPAAASNAGEESEETKMVRELDQLQLHLEQLTRQEKKLLELHQGREDKLASTLLRGLKSQAQVIKERIKVLQAAREAEAAEAAAEANRIG
jgi:hypothetical protein